MAMLHSRAYWRRRGRASAPIESEAEARRAGTTSKKALFTHICIPVDGTEASFEAAFKGVTLAAAMRAKVYVFHVLQPLSAVTYVAELIQFMDATYQDMAVDRARKYLDRVCALARDAGVECQSGYAFDQRPYCAIAGAIAREGCDLVVMGTHSWEGWARHVRGSETVKLIQCVDVPVLAMH